MSALLSSQGLERLLVLEATRLTEQAALAASHFVGMDDKPALDAAGTGAMRHVLQELNIRGRVVIGEGEMDEAPMLYIGETLGRGYAFPLEDTLEVDIAVDPVEGTNVAAKGLPNSIAVIALSERGGLMHAPDIYMDKLVVGPPAAGKIDLKLPVAHNLAALAESLDRQMSELVVAVLDRERHAQLIRDIRQTGARVKLIGEGDVVASLAVAVRGTGVHALMGIGGAPEGVITAAAMRCLGAEIQAQFLPQTDQERARCLAMGVDPDKVYTTDELASGGQIVFSATGITDGDLLDGVRLFGGGARTHSLVMGLHSRVVRLIDTVHLLDEGARVTVRV
ncbi:MAG: class II fructose-bisphosphatase [Deinococcaceae bacterium]